VSYSAYFFTPSVISDQADLVHQIDCKYVMWGQRIWEKSQDSVKPWNEWRYQACTVIKPCTNGDRGDNTANHWDHVHVSYA
jgi:hypothetical protein